MFLIRFKLLQLVSNAVSQIVVPAVFVFCAGKTILGKPGLAAACINTKKGNRLIAFFCETGHSYFLSSSCLIMARYLSISFSFR